MTKVISTVEHERRIRALEARIEELESRIAQISLNNAMRSQRG